MLNVEQSTSKPAPILNGGMEVSFGDYGSRAERERMEAWIESKVKASQKAPTCEIVTLTPMLAALLLLRNEANRPLSVASLDRNKKDIKSGLWQFNGQSIVLSKDGKLNDGQHRCHTVIETNTAIQIVMVFGAERESRFTLDQGTPRTVGHYFKMRGVGDYNNVAGIMAHITAFEKLGRIGARGVERPTKAEVWKCAQKYDDIADHFTSINKSGANLLCAKTVLGFCRWAIARKTATEDVDTFFGMLLLGANLGANSPILYCRKKLLALRDGGRNDVPACAEVIFRTWNKWRKGETGGVSVQGGRLPKLER